MWNVLRFISLLFLFANISLAQNPSGVSLVITTKNGKTTFRKGEPIPVELRFQATAQGRYQVIADPSHRVHLNSPRVYDQFTAEPAADAVDPLREQTGILELFIGPPPGLVPLTEAPIIIEEVINDWISFRKAGWYQITARTFRLRLVDNSNNSEWVIFPESIPLKSNTIEIEIVPTPEDWAKAQLQRAVSSLTSVPMPSDVQNEQEVAAAARVLRYLETQDAALAMVRFFDRGPTAMQLEISAGLYGSPFRQKVISALEDGLKSPEKPATQKWINTLAELATGYEFGPAPPYEKDPAGNDAWHQHFMANRERYMKIISGSVAGKQGQAGQ